MLAPADFDRAESSSKEKFVYTNFSFDDDSALSKSAGANISDSVIKVFPINSMNESEDEFLIDVSSLFVSESLTPIKPIPHPEAPPPDFIWGPK